QAEENYLCTGGWVLTMALDGYDARIKNAVAPVRSVLGYGAVGDGITNDTAALQAAFDAVTPGGGSVFVPPGRYIITDTVVLGSDTSLQLSPAATLDGSGLAADVPLIRASGSLSDAKPLISDATSGDVSLSVRPGDEAAFKPGGWVRVRSD